MYVPNRHNGYIEWCKLPLPRQICIIYCVYKSPKINLLWPQPKGNGETYYSGDCDWQDECIIIVDGGIES